MAEIDILDDTLDRLQRLELVREGRQAPPSVSPRFPGAERGLQEWGDIALSGIPAAAEDFFGGLLQAITPPIGEPAKSIWETSPMGLVRALGSPLQLLAKPAGGAVERVTGQPLVGVGAELLASILAPQRLAGVVPEAIQKAGRAISPMLRSARAGGLPGVAGGLVREFTGPVNLVHAGKRLSQANAAGYVRGRLVADALYTKAREGMATAKDVTAQPLIDHLEGLMKQAITPAMQTTAENLLAKVKGGATERLKIEGEVIEQARNLPFSIFDESLQEVNRLIDAATRTKDIRALRGLKNAIEDNMSIFKPAEGYEESLKVFNQARKAYRTQVGPILDVRELVDVIQREPSEVVEAITKLSPAQIDRRVLPQAERFRQATTKGREKIFGKLAPEAYYQADLVSGMAPESLKLMRRAIVRHVVGEGTTMYPHEAVKRMEAMLGGPLGTSQANLKLKALFGDEAEAVGRIFQKIKGVTHKTAKSGKVIETAMSAGVLHSPFLGAHMTSRGAVGLAGATLAGAGAYTGSAEAVLAGGALMTAPWAITALLSIKGGARLLDTALSAPLGSPERMALAGRVAAVARAAAAGMAGEQE